MKCAIIIADGIKQIILSPETDSERMALSYITSDDNLSVEIKPGTLYDQHEVPQAARGYIVEECMGGYLRAFQQAGAVMLVLRRKPAPPDNTPTPTRAE